MDWWELARYLHEHIPLSYAMGVEVVVADHTGVTLRAPLAPNINHRETVFGGSASAVAILAAWALLYVRLQQEYVNCRIVIQRNRINYARPMVSGFVASSTIQNALAWEKFVGTFKRRRGLPYRQLCSVTENTLGNLKVSLSLWEPNRPHRNIL